MAFTCVDPPLTYHHDPFFQNVNEFLFYVVPLVLCIVLWKLLVTNRSTPRGDVTVLGLDVSTSTYSPRPKQLRTLLFTGKSREWHDLS